MRRSSFTGASVLLLALSACAEAGPTTVGGEVSLHLNSTTTPQLVFPSGTSLAADVPGANSGLVVGHCTLMGDATEVSFTRSPDGSTPATGFVFFQISVDSPSAPYVGHVMAQVDSDVYEADCDLVSFARERSHGVVDFELAGCTLMTPAPSGVNSVVVDAALSLDACTKR